MQSTIIFFEVQDWEKNILLTAFPQAEFSTEKLSIDTIKLALHAKVISSFIYSNINADILSNLPNLKYIATRSTGFDHIDVPYCTKHNILVSNVPEYGSNTVAEDTFALILSLSRKIYQSA